MHEHEPTQLKLNPVTGRFFLSRNNLEFAGVVVFFFSMAVIFAMTIIVMMCQPANEMNEKSSVDHPVTINVAHRL